MHIAIAMIASSEVSSKARSLVKLGLVGHSFSRFSVPMLRNVYLSAMTCTDRVVNKFTDSCQHGLLLPDTRWKTDTKDCIWPASSCGTSGICCLLEEYFDFFENTC